MLYRRTVHPKKSLGQHFLKNTSTAERIAQTLSGYPDLPVLEVGPGTGMLTQFLLRNHRDLTTVEPDAESVTYLQAHFPALNGHIIQGDFLKLNLNVLFPAPFCVIGNYPYNISSQIFFKVLEHRDKIPCCAGMIQKEVAERLTSPPGKKTYGIISTLIQTWYDVEYLFTVEPDEFDPPPKVKSAVVRMTRNKRTALNCDETLFKTIVKTAFNQRRKMLRNSLQTFLKERGISPSLPVFEMRPEQLAAEEFIELAAIFHPR